MIKMMRERARLELERQMRPYRSARKNARPPEGWLRAVRLAMGLPAEQIARQLAVTSKMVFYMERAEMKGTITLDRLRRQAQAVECDLVYGLVPWSQSLEDRAMELVEQAMWRKRYMRKSLR